MGKTTEIARHEKVIDTEKLNVILEGLGLNFIQSENGLTEKMFCTIFRSKALKSYQLKNIIDNLDKNSFGVAVEDIVPIAIREYCQAINEQRLDYDTREEMKTEIIKMISVFAENGFDTKSAKCLISALSEKNMPVAKFLLKNGCDVNGQDENGNTPLISVLDNVKMIKLLLKQSIDVNTQNNDGDTVLMLAIKNKKKDMISLLIEQEGIDFNLQNNKGNTALVLLAHSIFKSWDYKWDLNKGEIVKILDRFIKLCADPSILNNEGQGLLSMIDDKVYKHMTNNEKKTVDAITKIKRQATEMVNDKRTEQSIAIASLDDCSFV